MITCFSGHKMIFVILKVVKINILNCFVFLSDLVVDKHESVSERVRLVTAIPERSGSVVFWGVYHLFLCE